MDRAAISSAIERSAAELRAGGVAALYLFGSRARGDASAASDIDLAFDVADDADEAFSLLDQGRLLVQLQDLLDGRVDFVERRTLRPRIRQRVEGEMVRLL